MLDESKMKKGGVKPAPKTPKPCIKPPSQVKKNQLTVEEVRDFIRNASPLDRLAAWPEEVCRKCGDNMTKDGKYWHCWGCHESDPI